MTGRASLGRAAARLALAAGAAAVGWQVGRLGDHPTTTTRLSPDETTRARLVELGPAWAIDRNFAVTLEPARPGGPGRAAVLLATSADEGRPAGTERFVWSRDGTKLLLVGRHCFVRADLLLDSGDQAYFLHDLRAGRSWINSATDARLPPLTADLIAGVEFTEPVILRPRAKVDPDSAGKPE